jgi:hypothetical protein
MNCLNELSGVLIWRKEAAMPAESCIPIIPSANLEKSLRLWVDGLGFSRSSEIRKDDTLIFCMLRKDELCFMLNQRAWTPVKPGRLGGQGYTLKPPSHGRKSGRPIGAPRNVRGGVVSYKGGISKREAVALPYRTRIRTILGGSWMLFLSFNRSRKG